MANVAETHIQPTLVETYTKHTETDITLEHELIVREVRPSASCARHRPRADAALSLDVCVCASQMGVDDMEVDASSSPVTTRESVVSPGSPRRPLMIDTEMGAADDATPTLSPDEQKQILQSDSMEAFLTKASRLVERALASTSTYDFMVDYGATVEDDLLAEDAAESLKLQFTFADDKWTKHRAVTDMDVSPFYPELVLVSYTARDFLDEDDKEISTAKEWDTMGNSATGAAAILTDSSSVTDGVVLLWSTALPTRPEYKFTCHSQVTSASFNPFDRHLIFGGTYSGQIVVWDTRAKAAPVQKTSLSSSCHTHPIYAMSVVGTKSAYQYVPRVGW